MFGGSTSGLNRKTERYASKYMHAVAAIRFTLTLDDSLASAWHAQDAELSRQRIRAQRHIRSPHVTHCVIACVWLLANISSGPKVYRYRSSGRKIHRSRSKLDDGFRSYIRFVACITPQTALNFRLTVMVTWSAAVENEASSSCCFVSVRLSLYRWVSSFVSRCGAWWERGE